MMYYNADFDFSSGLYDVIQVSRGEYDSCSSNQAFKVFMEGPIDFPLVEKGASYFICNISNYCQLGLKVSVVVEEETMNAPTPSSPSPVPSSQVMDNSPHLAPTA